MNIGLEYARKRCDADDWFCKFDDDDYYGPEYLNSIAQRANDSQAIARTKVWMRTPEGMLWTVDNGELSPHGPTLASRVDVADDFPEVHGWGEDGLWVQSMLAKGIVFSNGPLEGFCWIRYPKGHGHSYPLQSRHFRMLGVGIEEFGRYDVRVVDGQEIRQGKVLEPLPMDMADFAATLGASIGK
jgi:glycosyltransferase involved in cell wall biosynthesis